jgi:hypothetical protein
MLALRHSTANWKILTVVRNCPFLMYWPPLKQKQKRHAVCPILKVRVNKAARIVGLVSEVID